MHRGGPVRLVMVWQCGLWLIGFSMDLGISALHSGSGSPCVWPESPFNCWQQQIEDMKSASHRPLNREPNPPTSQERLALALATARIGTWELDLTDPNALLLSPEFRKILHLTEAELDPSIRVFLNRVHPLDRFGVIRKIIRAIRLGLDPELEFRVEAPGRGTGWLLCRGRLYRDEDGRPLRLVGVGIDVTEQKFTELEILRRNSQLEKRIAERTTQLEATNRELEAFCYSVSHDLRAPLRSIRGFNEVLLERYASSLDIRGQEFLRRACQASYYMDELIESLLKLSRVGRAELLPRTVDLSALATGVAAELSAADPSHNANFLIAPQSEGDWRRRVAQGDAPRKPVTQRMEVQFEKNARPH